MRGEYKNALAPSGFPKRESPQAPGHRCNPSKGVSVSATGQECSASPPRMSGDLDRCHQHDQTEPRPHKHGGKVFCVCVCVCVCVFMWLSLRMCVYVYVYIHLIEEWESVYILVTLKGRKTINRLRLKNGRK